MNKKLRKAAVVVALVLAMITSLGAEKMEVEAAEVNYYATHPYAIYVNRLCNVVTVMGLDDANNYTVPVKAFTCSVGRVLDDTPAGTYRTTNYYEWRKLFGNTYGRYAIRFNGHVLFHSIPYTAPNVGAMITNAYNNLGQPASAGCVRLSVPDEKWLYDNTKAGTVVVVYDDAANPGPLGKPATLKVDANSPFAKYDPSDCNFANVISGRTGLYLKKDYADGFLHMYRYAKTENFGDLIGMVSANGEDLGKWQYKLQITGNFDTSVPGVYDVGVVATDYTGATASANYKMIVE